MQYWVSLPLVYYKEFQISYAVLSMVSCHSLNAWFTLSDCPVHSRRTEWTAAIIALSDSLRVEKDMHFLSCHTRHVVC